MCTENKIGSVYTLCIDRNYVQMNMNTKRIPAVTVDGADICLLLEFHFLRTLIEHARHLLCVSALAYAIQQRIHI